MPPTLAGTALKNMSIVIGVIDAIAVMLRLLARWNTKAVIGVDDYLVVFSLLPMYGMIALSHLGVYKGGLGLSMAEVTPAQISVFFKLLMAAFVTYSLTITTIKMSILAFYRRIFATESFKKKSLIVGTACLAWFIVTLFTNIFQCRPFKAAFDPELVFTDKCFDLRTYYLGVCASNLVLDVIVLALPVHEVWKLKLSIKQKTSLSGVFLLGGFVCFAGAMRIVAIIEIQPDDLTSSSAWEYAWSCIEPASAIFCACIVTYRPLFMNFKSNLSKVLSSFGGTSTTKLEDKERATSTDSEHSQIRFLVPLNFKRQYASRFQRLNDKENENGFHVISV